MKKATFAIVSVASVALAAGAFAAFAHAQAYTEPYTPYTSPYTTSYNSACVQLTASMTIGSTDPLTGGQVSTLQSFLVRLGYLPSTLITGYFGPITASDIARFQSTQGIAPSGVIGPLTRAAIGRVSCGTSGYVNPAQPEYPGYPTYPTYQTNTGYPTNTTYPGYPSYPYGYNGLELNSLAANNQNGETIITLSGYGFNESDNTVNVGGTQLSNVSSSNGTNIEFTLPDMAPGTYPITVTNSSGTSNSLQYTISGPTCGYYNGQYQNSCSNCVYNYNGSTNYSSYDNQPCSTSGLEISSLSATSANVGTTLTIYGTGFTSSNNTVYFNGTPVSNVYSSNGSQLFVTVPNVNSNYYSGTYSVYVVNGNGQTSNSVSLQIF